MLGLDDLPSLQLKNAPTMYVADAFVANVLRLKRMMLAPAFVGELAEGALISIDGQIASHAIGETIFCSYKLIDAVDTWLALH
jgi:hypothetical protein